MTLIDNQSKQTSDTSSYPFQIEIISFGYKSNSPPKANMLFDVRFIDNPFWVEELRPLTGLHENVQDFVLKQDVAQNFLAVFSEMIKVVLPMQIISMNNKVGTASAIDRTFIIAFGCTGGQHRSAAMVEESARLIGKLFPQYTIKIRHCEIEKQRDIPPVQGESRL